jgi:acetyl-CoA carboxylase biotin carboxylase subunit
MTPPIQALLVANRGEIAIRVIRACRELGIRSVAIYSDPDRNAAHVAMADEAVSIGGSTPRESYLNGAKIIDVARLVHADAIHPGYGFLSENAEFAAMVRDAGLRFVGPPPEAIRLLGDKVAAKALARKSNVPTAGGSDGAIDDPRIALKIAEEIGFPVLIKAAAGGGGKGMRVAMNAEEVTAGLEAAQREAQSAFGDGRVFVEKYIVNPRHIEFQILADEHGNVVHLGERECSIQRRHQKIVEESPSAALDSGLRKRMGEAACAMVKSAGYTNAGTVEFLLDDAGAFYFLEVNTRLQVEHPVTEMVTGIDLVHRQISIANGHQLDIRQEDIIQHGWAIECRIIAEDPYDNFLPSTGTISTVRLPGGQGVRNDTALVEGLVVSPLYDSMLGKLIVWGETRDVAIARMKRALDEMKIVGVATSAPFCRFVLEQKDFASGVYNTGFVGAHLNSGLFIPTESQMHAAVAAVAIEFGHRSPKFIGSCSSRWIEKRVS